MSSVWKASLRDRARLGLNTKPNWPKTNHKGVPKIDIFAAKPGILCRLDPLRQRLPKVQVTEQDKVIARVVPAVVGTVPQPDFLARAKAIWGEQPAGKPLSEVVAEARGGES